MTQNIWIVTIGSSDVQLQTKNWESWRDEIVDKLYGLESSFEPVETKQVIWGQANEESEKITYRLHARVLGLAYKAQPEEIGKYLTFPLLDNFAQQLKLEQAVLTKIVVILTDQEDFFTDDDRRKDICPYWQDTSMLQQALKDCFFRSDQYDFKNVELDWIFLSPQYEADERYGLDHWSQVLDLVKTNLNNIENIESVDRVYVSYQAGTPAISSAIQFCSLAKFGDCVKFLVSNEYNPSFPEKPLEGSSYLRGIRIQEAKALLKRYDYSGVQDILGFRQIKPTTPETKRFKYLLDAAEQWNFAEFQKFKKFVVDRKLLSTPSFLWWKTGYESAYLAWVRLQQGSPVDAMVHSFRAVEGVTSLWAEKTHQTHVRRDPKKGLQLKYSICNQFTNLTYLFGKIDQSKQEIGAYGKALFALLREDRNQDWQINSHISTFCKPLNRDYSGNDIFEERNNLFHRLEGLQANELFEIWNTSDQDTWIARVLGCLNFISGQNYKFIDFDQKENCDEAASLMVKVHQELKEAIAKL